MEQIHVLIETSPCSLLPQSSEVAVINFTSRIGYYILEQIPLHTSAKGTGHSKSQENGCRRSCGLIGLFYVLNLLQEWRQVAMSNEIYVQRSNCFLWLIILFRLCAKQNFLSMSYCPSGLLLRHLDLFKCSLRGDIP